MHYIMNIDNSSKSLQNISDAMSSGNFHVINDMTDDDHCSVKNNVNSYSNGLDHLVVACEKIYKQGWFDRNCGEAKSECNKALKNLRRDRSQLKVQEYLHLIMIHKPLCKVKCHEFQKSQLRKL